MSGKKRKQLSKRASGRTTPAHAGRSGSGAGASPGTSITAVLNSGKLRELYSTMLQCRMLVEPAHDVPALLKERVIDEADIGREAVLVGAVTHALPGDSTVLAQGSFLARYIRRAPLSSVLAHLFASGMTPARAGAGEEKSQGSPAQLTMAKSMTLAHKAAGKPNIALAFPGSDVAALPFHYDALALAARHKLSLVCLIETGPTFEWTAERQNTQSDSASHFPEIAVDGCDVVAVFRVAQEAVRRARTGHGPSLIHCVMPGRNSGHRTVHNLAEPLRDPLEVMKNYLRRKDLWSDEWQDNIMDSFGKELEAARAAAQHTPDSTLPVDDVYSAQRRDTPSPAGSAVGKFTLSES
jgi:acetoin:2,6-dichlorophenolindophenol oxidoreductase subunit alpha